MFPFSPSSRNQIAVTVAGFIGFTGFTLVMPFLPLYFGELGVEDVGEIAFWSGLSLGITPALTALLSPFWGRLADRFGRKIMVERSLASFVVVMGAMAYVSEAWQVFALRTMQGLFAGYGALTITMAAESVPRDRMAAAIGTVQTAHRLGPALGPVIGGTVAQLVGLRRAFLVSAGFYLLAFLLVLVMYREPLRDADDAAIKNGPGRVTFRQVLGFENFLLLMATVFALQFVDRSIGPILPLYIVAMGVGVSRAPLVAGVIFSAAAIAAALGNQVSAWRLRRSSPRRIIVGATAMTAFASLGFAVGTGLEVASGAVALFGLGIGMAATAAFTAAGTVIPAGSQGVGFGVLTSASLAGLATSPIVSGLLAATSLRAVFLLDGILLGILATVVSRAMVDTPVRT